MKKDYIKYIASLLIFGTNGIVASVITLSSAEIVFSRTILGSLFLGLVLLVKKEHIEWKKLKKQWIWLIVSGVAMGASWILLFQAYRSASVGTATLAYYCGPVLVMALSPFLFKEKLTIGKIVGILAVVTGMLMVNGSDLKNEGMTMGLVFGLLSALLYATMIISNKRVTGIEGVSLTLLQLLIAALTVGPYACLTHTGSFELDAVAIGAILFLGIVNSGLACYLYFSSINALPAQSVAICSYMDPASAIIFAAIFLRERMSLLQVVGAALIIGGAAFGELYKKRKS